MTEFEIKVNVQVPGGVELAAPAAGYRYTCERPMEGEGDRKRTVLWYRILHY